MMNLDSNWPPMIVAYVHGDGPGMPENIWVSDPAPCCCCERVTSMFVNRWGRTMCTTCDIEAEKQRLEAN